MTAPSSRTPCGDCNNAGSCHCHEIEVLPSQVATLWYVPVAALLFVAQTGLGGLLAHYYMERGAFFGVQEIAGVDILRLLSFTAANTFHLDLGILWITATWLAAGIFLAGSLTGNESTGQRTFDCVLLAALVLVTVGGLIGVWLGINGYIDPDQWYWWLVGYEGLENVEVGRLWQFGLLAGFAFWTILVWHGFRPLLDEEPHYGLAHMIVYVGGSIGLLFVAGMLYTPEMNIVITRARVSGGLHRRWRPFTGSEFPQIENRGSFYSFRPR